MDDDVDIALVEVISVVLANHKLGDRYDQAFIYTTVVEDVVDQILANFDVVEKKIEFEGRPWSEGEQDRNPDYDSAEGEGWP